MKKSFRNIALSALITIGGFTAITYTSCTKDECKDVVCNNGGTCVSGNCSCPTGYEGSNCSTFSRDKILGVYTGSETCTIGTDNYTITLSSNSDNVKLTLTNLYNQNFTAICTMTGATTFNFSGTQGTGGTTTTFTGTGSVSGSQLTVTYTISSTGASNACTFIGSR